MASLSIKTMPNEWDSRPQIEETLTSLHHGWNQEQTRNNQILCQPQYGRKMTTELLVTGLGKERIILGFPSLQEQNPEINWKTGEFSWREPRKQRFLNLPP